MKRCRHCREKNANRPRGLCWSCFYTPLVREMYPTCPKFGPKMRHEPHEPPTPDSPTLATPGTSEKIAVMESRYAAGKAVIHPADDRIPNPQPRLKVHKVYLKRRWP